MSFIAKNPLILPEIEHTPSVPNGTRGLFAKKDGWYEIDSNNNMKKITPDEEKLKELEEIINKLVAKSLVKTVTINLLSSGWVEDSNNQYSQVVSIEGVTEYSKIDLQPTPEQLVVFHEKDVTFVTENEDGIVTIYCIGQKPLNDYMIQATITEVETSG